MVYEGINSLCFLCGQVGHKKEKCQYVILETMDQPSPEKEGATKDPISFGLVTTKDEYGPWIFVARKKSAGNLLQKRPWVVGLPTLNQIMSIAGPNSLAGPTRPRRRI